MDLGVYRALVNRTIWLIYLGGMFYVSGTLLSAAYLYNNPRRYSYFYSSISNKEIYVQRH